MEKSYKFRNTEENMKKILRILLENEDFKKYIFYLDGNPLAQPDVTENLLKSGHILLQPFDPDILEEQRITVFFYPADFNLRKLPLTDVTYLFIICIPTKYWLLEGFGDMRAVRIADEILMDIDQQPVAGVADVRADSGRLLAINKNHVGISLSVHVSNVGLKGMR